AEEIDRRLSGVPVFSICNASHEFVLVSGTNSGKTLGIFCFSEADAEKMLNQMRSVDPSGNSASRVVALDLSKVFQFKVDGVALRLVPEASQIKNALELSREAGFPDEMVRGVPTFQSKQLLLRSEGKGYRPVFFRKEDVEKYLSRASGGRDRPVKRGDIEVGVLEDMVRGMMDRDSSKEDVVFIPPGLD
ncbi:hypothetical protein M569_16693, partial [Genlisea aurea]